MTPQTRFLAGAGPAACAHADPTVHKKNTPEHHPLLRGRSQSRGRESPSSQRRFHTSAPAEFQHPAPLAPTRSVAFPQETALRNPLYLVKDNLVTENTKTQHTHPPPSDANARQPHATLAPWLQAPGWHLRASPAEPRAAVNGEQGWSSPSWADRTHLSSSSRCEAAPGFPLVPAALPEASAAESASWGTEESVSPGGVEGGAFWDTPSTVRSSKAPCKVASPVLQPCSWGRSHPSNSGVLWRWHRTGRSQSQLPLGRGHDNSGFIPGEKEDLSTAQGHPNQLLPVISLVWMDQEKREEEVQSRAGSGQPWAGGGSRTEGYATWATAADVAPVSSEPGLRTERTLQEPLQQPRSYPGDKKDPGGLSRDRPSQLMGSYSE